MTWQGAVKDQTLNCILLIPALGRQRQEDLCSQPAWTIEWVQDSKDCYTEKPCGNSLANLGANATSMRIVLLHGALHLQVTCLFYNYIEIPNIWKFVFILCLPVICLHVCICTTCMSCVSRDQKSTSYSMQRELHGVVSNHGAGTRTRSSARAAHALMCWVISLTPCSSYFK